MTDMKLSILIPVYNEVNYVLELLRRVQAEPHQKEIIIVDDASTDGTVELLKGLTDSNLRVIYNQKNAGKGACLKTAIRHMRGDIAIIQDADLEYYPDEYGILVNKIIEGKADVVFGTRFAGSRRVFHFYHYLGNALINLIANFLFDANLTDLMTGYKAFRADVLKRLVLKADRFGIEPEITGEVFKRRFKVYEVPISYDGRGYDEGKKIKWTDFFSCLYWLIASRLRGIDAGTETLERVSVLSHYNRWTYEKMKPCLGTRVLEIGSGIGTISHYLVSKGREVLLTDIEETYTRVLKDRYIGNPHVKVLQMDIQNVCQHVPDESVDTVVGVNVMEHIQDDDLLIANLKKIIRTGGSLFILVPAHMALYGQLDKKIGHFRRYSKAELSEKLQKQGLKVEKIEYMNFLSAIGWFITYKIFRSKKMPKNQLRLLNLIIPSIAFIEKFVRFPFGLSVIAIARKPL